MLKRTTTFISNSDRSSYESTFSRSSNHTNTTNATSFQESQPKMKDSEQSAFLTTSMRMETDAFVDESLPRSSTETFASTIASEDELSSTMSGPLPKERTKCFVSDAIPSTPGEFAKLFPSTRRLMIQHDDSTRDGNTNLRIDTEIVTHDRRKQKLTLFHLRMKDLEERHFSLRRYCRDSGREVASCKRRYVKPVAKDITQGPNFQRSLNSALHNLGKKQGSRSRSDSGYESDEDSEDDAEEAIQKFAAQAGVEATVRTSAIRLEFSNYAQVIVEPRRSSKGMEYGFEYWGNLYCWKRRTHYDNGEIIYAYELVNAVTNKRIAGIMPDVVSRQEAAFEASQGAWIPASSMRLLDPNVSSDLGDVIIATGLIALADDALRR